MWKRPKSRASALLSKYQYKEIIVQHPLFDIRRIKITLLTIIVFFFFFQAKIYTASKNLFPGDDFWSVAIMYFLRV